MNNTAGRRRRFLLVAAAIAIIAGLIVLVPRFGFHPVGTGVMAPAVQGGEVTLLAENATVGRGDVVVIDAWNDVSYTVRVIGVAGDVVVCCDESDRLTINGKPVAESYAHGDTATFGPFELTVPRGRVFVLGDARSISVDSRSHLDDNGGTLPVTGVRGRVVAVAYPLWQIRPVTGGDAFVPLLSGLGLLGVGLATLLVANWAALHRSVRRLQALFTGVRERRAGP